MIAAGKKVATAIAERPLSLGSPHSMCPDVHPFDIWPFALVVRESSTKDLLPLFPILSEHQSLA